MWISNFLVGIITVLLAPCLLATDQMKTQAIRILAGSDTDFVDPQGRLWKADYGFTGGNSLDRSTMRIASIENSWRYRSAREGVQSYDFDLPDGRYDVLLYFVECDPEVQQKGERVFSIRVGNRLFQDLDLYERAGGLYVPFAVKSDVVVIHGKLSICFDATRFRATISAIEIVPWGPGSDLRPAPEEFVVEDFSSYADDNAIRKLFTRNTTHNEAIVGIDRNTFGPGAHGLRIDYRTDKTLDYGEQIWITYHKKADLSNYKSLRFLVKGDGSFRTVAIILRNEKGEEGAYRFLLSGTDPVEIQCPLLHMGQWNWTYNKPENPSFNSPITEVTFWIYCGQQAELGIGSVFIGPISASPEEVPGVLPPVDPGGVRRESTYLFDNFETYDSNEELWPRYVWHSRGDMLRFVLASGDSCSSGNCMKIDYFFSREGHAALITLRDMDLRKYNVFRFWVKPCDSGDMLNIDFATTGGLTFSGIRLDGHTPRIVEIPLKELLTPTAALTGNLEIAFSLEKRGASEGGTLFLDDLEFARNPNFGLELKPMPPLYPLPGDAVTRINAGANADMTDANGDVWLSDRGFYWGYPARYSETIHYDSDGYPELLRTERFAMAGYGFAVPSGDYIVKLHFAESWEPAAGTGQRVFGVRINSETLPDMDIYAEAAGLFKHIVRTVPIRVTDGRLEIVFTQKIGLPKIDGIEIIPKKSAGRIYSEP